MVYVDLDIVSQLIVCFFMGLYMGSVIVCEGCQLNFCHQSLLENVASLPSQICFCLQ